MPRLPRFRKSKQLEFSGQSTREERSIQNRNSRDPHRVPLQFLANNWSIHVPKEITWGQKKELLQRTRGNRGWFSHRSRGNACYQQPGWETSWFTRHLRENTEGSHLMLGQRGPRQALLWSYLRALQVRISTIYRRNEIFSKLNKESTNNPIKNGGKSEQTLQQKYTEAKLAHEKVLNIICL